MISTRACKSFAIATLAIFWAVGVFGQAVQTHPIVIHELKHDVSAPLRELAAKAAPPAKGMVIMREHRSPKHIFQVTPGIDPVIQGEDSYIQAVSTTQLLNFDAITAAQGGATPPDTNGS